MQMIITSFTVV